MSLSRRCSTDPAQYTAPDPDKVPVMRSLHCFAAALLTVAASPAFSESHSATDVHAELSKQLPGVKADDVRASKVPGLFEVRMGERSAYVTEDGKYLIRGDMFEVASRANLSDIGRRADRRALLMQLDPGQAITFAPANPKHTITVFTDIECAYCRKLHGEIGLINAQGIAVRYAAYPRGGPNTPAWTQMEAVWCSADRQDALTRAKLGQTIERPAACKAAPVAAQYQLAQKLGIQGTPLVILEDGRIAGGYLPAEALAKMLEAQP